MTADQPKVTTDRHKATRRRRIAFVMGLEAATLAAMALLHLSGLLDGSGPFSELGAGVAEIVICLVLAYGAARLMRAGPRARAIAVASTVFAIVGFLIGLSTTIQGGGAIDIAYHLTMLPLLGLTLRALVRRDPHQTKSSRLNYLERSLT